MVVTCIVLVSTMTRRSPGEAVGAVVQPTPFESVDVSVAKTGHVMGSEQAKVAMIEFSDFQCPFCASFARDTLPQLKREFIGPGTVQFIYRHNPLEALHPFALKAGTASQCAQQQNRFWDMHDAIYSQQSTLTDNKFLDLAKLLRLDVGRFSKCIDDTGTLEEVKKDQAEAASLGVRSTPTFLIGRVQSNGTVKATRKVSGAAPYEAFKAALTGV